MHLNNKKLYKIFIGVVVIREKEDSKFKPRQNDRISKIIIE